MCYACWGNVNLFSAAPADEGASFPFKGSFSFIVFNYSRKQGPVLFYKEDERGFAAPGRQADREAKKAAMSALCSHKAQGLGSSHQRLIQTSQLITALKKAGLWSAPNQKLGRVLTSAQPECSVLKSECSG